MKKMRYTYANMLLLWMAEEKDLIAKKFINMMWHMSKNNYENLSTGTIGYVNLYSVIGGKLYKAKFSMYSSKKYYTSGLPDGATVVIYSPEISMTLYSAGIYNPKIPDYNQYDLSYVDTFYMNNKNSKYIGYARKEVTNSSPKNRKRKSLMDCLIYMDENMSLSDRTKEVIRLAKKFDKVYYSSEMTLGRYESYTNEYIVLDKYVAKIKYGASVKSIKETGCSYSSTEYDTPCLSFIYTDEKGKQDQEDFVLENLTDVSGAYKEKFGYSDTPRVKELFLTDADMV